MYSLRNTKKLRHQFVIVILSLVSISLLSEMFAEEQSKIIVIPTLVLTIFFCFMELYKYNIY